MTLNSRRLAFSFSIYGVLFLVMVTFLALASAHQDRAEQPVWRVTMPANARSRSTITIRNQCKQTHSFTVVPRDVPYLQLPAAATVQVPGQNNQALGVVFNTAGMRPGEYRGSVTVKCETCGEERGCSQENELLPVHLTITPLLEPTPTPTPRSHESPSPTPTPLLLEGFNQQSGQITGQKVNDTNCNGKNDNEPGLAGWTITATNTGTGVTLSTVTDAAGFYYFKNLAPGTYTVSEVAQAGWTQSLPGGVGSYTVTLPQAIFIYNIQPEVIRRDFANCKKHEEGIKITGRKINDTNCNGKADLNEPGLAGWTITAINTGTGATALAVTDVNGSYSFNLPPGTYTISEGPQAGWTQSMPGGAGTYTVTLVWGQVIQPKDFANCRKAERGRITGRKIDDVNCNGKTDVNEPGLAGWIITATNNGTGATVTTVTDANGFYSFNNLAPGTYTISESPQTGWTQTMPAGAGTYAVTIAGGQVIERDFANCKKPDEKECALVRGREAVCKADGSGYTYTFSVTNNSGRDVTQILLTPPVGSGLVLSDQTFPLTTPLPNGQSTTITVDIGNVKPGTESCFFVTLMTKDGPCCTVKVCPVLPDCCATATGEFGCDPKGGYTGTFTIMNTSPNIIKNIYLYPPAGVTLSQNYFAVSLAPGQSFTTPVITIKGAKPGRFCFRVSMHTEGMKECCEVEVCIVLPQCGHHTGVADSILSPAGAVQSYDSRRRNSSPSSVSTN